MPTLKPKPYMTSKKFVFTLEVRNETWDCYHFRSSDGKAGTLGFTRRGVKFVLGLMCAGHLTEEQAKQKLEEGNRQEAN